MRATDVDLDAGTCRIARAWKRSEQGWESVRRRRGGRCAPSTCPRLRSTWRGAVTADGGEYMFVNGAGSPVRQQNFFNEAWSEARKALAPKTPRIHDLRYTCASWMIGAGVPLVVVSRHLGHEDITTTANTYSRRRSGVGQNRNPMRSAKWARTGNGIPPGRR